MAHVVNLFKIMDGPSHITLHCHIQGDGVSGELTNYVILDPAVDLIPAMPHRQDLIVKQVWHETTGFSIKLLFNALTPWPFWTLAPGANINHDWRFFGGLRDHSDAAGFGLTSDGKLMISTKGLGASLDSATFILWMEKRDRSNPQVD